MDAIRLFLVTFVCTIVSCNGFILPKESKEYLIPADLLLDSMAVRGDHVKSIEDESFISASKGLSFDSVPVGLLSDMALRDHVKDIDGLKRVERAPSNNTSSSSNQSSSSTNQNNKSSTNQNNSNKNSGQSENSSSGKGSSSGSSSNSQNSDNNNKNNGKSDNKTSKGGNSGDNSSKNSKVDNDNDENDDEEDLLQSIPRCIKESFQAVVNIFKGLGDDDVVDLMNIPKILHNLNDVFGK